MGMGNDAGVCVCGLLSGVSSRLHSQRILTGNTAHISGPNASYWIVKCAKESQASSAESYSGENGIVFMQACCVEQYQLIYLYKQHFWESTVKEFIVSCNKTSFFYAASALDMSGKTCSQQVIINQNKPLNGNSGSDMKLRLSFVINCNCCQM